MTKKKETAEQKRIRELLGQIGRDPAFEKHGGGMPGIAEALDVSPQAIYKWVYSGRISIDGAKKIEALTDRRFKREQLAPWAFL